jgi:homogentisate 1,2-dioxygenase
MITVDVKNASNQTVGSLSFPDGTAQAVIDKALAAYVPAQKTVDEIVAGIRESAQAFGNRMINKMIEENLKLGISQEAAVEMTIDGDVVLMPKSDQVLFVCEQLMLALMTGTLTAVKPRGIRIKPEFHDGKYITNARLLAIVNECEAYMRIPLSAPWW